MRATKESISNVWSKWQTIKERDSARVCRRENGAGMARGWRGRVCGSCRYPDLTNAPRQKERSRLVERSLCDLPMAMLLSDPSFPVCRVACRTCICIHADTHVCICCTAPTTCRMALTLLLLAAPAYGYGSIIARHTETHLEAFVRRERATISLSIFPRALPLFHF